VCDLLDRQRAARESLVERGAVDELEDERREVTALFDSIDRTDVRMIERRERSHGADGEGRLADGSRRLVGRKERLDLGAERGDRRGKRLPDRRTARCLAAQRPRRTRG
jgi:hypothetical protein